MIVRFDLIPIQNRLMVGLPIVVRRIAVRFRILKKICEFFEHEDVIQNGISMLVGAMVSIIRS